MSFIKDTKDAKLIAFRFWKAGGLSAMNPNTRGVLIALVIIIVLFAAGLGGLYLPSESR
jgi:hypothetical protein